MIRQIRTLLERFPENERAVRALMRVDPAFAALAEEYQQIERELRRLTKAGEPDDMAEGLSKRKMAVEEDLLTKIEGYAPV
jgi:uncharacterized protein YdcH (DUF465 family)